MVLLLSRRLVLVSAAVGVAGSDARTFLAHLAVMHLVVSGRWIRLSRSNVQLLPPTVSSHCRHTVHVRGCCSYLDGSPSTMQQSTFFCPWVVDAPPCSSTVLSCTWWAVDVGCGCVGPACSYRVRRYVRVMVLHLSPSLVLVTAAVNVCLSVGL
jgi:hypothetical protein